MSEETGKNVQEQEVNLEAAALDLLGTAQEITVMDAESYESAAAFLKKIKDGIKARNDFFEPMKKISYAAWKAIVARENESIAALTDADGIVRKKVGVYLDEQEKIRKEAQRKAEAAAKVEADRKQKEFDARIAKAKKPETVERLEEEKEDVFVEPVFVKQAVEKTTKLDTGSITRKTDIKVEIVDPLAFIKGVASGVIPLTCVDIKPNKVKSWIKAADIKKVDGCRISETASVSVR